MRFEPYMLKGAPPGKGTTKMGVEPQPFMPKAGLVGPMDMPKGAAPGEVPTESTTLNFEEIKVTYTEYDAEGGSKGNVEDAWKVPSGEDE
jgi:hypothetical protein